MVVVIAILGILAALAIPRFGAVRESAEERTQVANARTIASAVMMYQAANGEDSLADAVYDGDDFDQYLTDMESRASYKITIDNGGEIYKIYTPSGKYWYPGTEVLSES